MSATVMNLRVQETQNRKLTDDQTDIVESIKCDCCGLTEECTAAYISRIKERYKGKWICGLCTEAVKDEVIRSPKMITTEEALNTHMKFRNRFRSSPIGNPSMDLILAMRQILKRSIGSPKSVPSSPTRRGNCDKLMRSESCFPALSLDDDCDSHSCPSIEEENEKEL